MTTSTFPVADVVRDVYRHAPGSPIRELKRYTELPGMISLAGGYPAPELMDVAGVEAVLSELSGPALAGALAYDATDGHAPLREALAALSTERGMPSEAGDVLVLTGSQQGIDLVARTVIAPGDVVLVEAPTYPAALAAFRLAGATVVEVAGDDDGVLPEALEQALATHAPKLLYLVPNFGNPSARVLADGRRRDVLALAVRHRCLVLEDDPYGDLWFDAAPPPSLYALRGKVSGAAEICVYLGSLSKTLAPGLRLGWMLGPAAIRRACVLAKQVDDMHASTLTQAVAARYLLAGRLAAHVPHLRAAYGARGRALAEALGQALSGRLVFAAPRGGMFLWARLEGAGADTSAWLQAAIRHQVLFVPGAAFFANGKPSPWLRLSFASWAEDGLREGAQRLGRSLDDVGA